MIRHPAKCLAMQYHPYINTDKCGYKHKDRRMTDTTAEVITSQELDVRQQHMKFCTCMSIHLYCMYIFNHFELVTGK